jgi:phosphoglycolate phosphatase-like HAD superfamily hydrolase
MRRFSLIVFDLDNTIYDWYRAFIPAFYNMVNVAVELLGVDRESLLDQLREVHIKHHDVEHPFSLMETELVQEMIRSRGAEAMWKLLDPAFHSFNRTRKANLALFPGTGDALNELRSYGISLAAYTDSKYYSAIGRIARLELGDVFDRIYCREKSPSLQSAISLDYTGSSLRDKVVEIPSHEGKPNPRVLNEIINLQCAGNGEVAYVGDSLAKDVLMAKRAGCFAVWAKYGAHTDRAMYERLVRVSHWTLADIERERNYAAEARQIEPDFICETSLQELIPVAGSSGRKSDQPISVTPVH